MKQVINGVSYEIGPGADLSGADLRDLEVR